MGKFNHFFKAALPALALTLGVDASAAPAHRNASAEPFRYARTVSPEFIKAQSPAQGLMRAPEAKPLKGNNDFGYLEGPDGSVWYYTADYDIEKKAVEGGYEGYYETIIKGYTFSIYDSHMELMGTITDVVTLADDEVRLAQVMPDIAVTRKFFNIDDNYEIVVSLACNRDYMSGAYPVTVYHSKVYSLGGQKDENGNDIAIDNIDGYIVADVDTSTDPWSENHYITFMTETIDMSLDDYLEMLASDKYILSIYQKAGYNGGAKKIGEFEMPLQQLPGDQMSSPFMLCAAHEGQAYFAVAKYKKPFFVNPVGDDENMTADNSLEITLHKASYSGLEEVSKTEIPLIPLDNYLYTFMGIGDFRYNGDIDFGHFDGNASAPCYTVTTKGFSIVTDTHYHSTAVYNAAGEKILSYPEGMENFVNLSDIPGENPQVMFTRLTDENYTFHFVDVYTGEEVMELPQIFAGIHLSASVDRAQAPGGYKWAFGTLSAYDPGDGFNYETVVWVNQKGTLDRIDNINLGQNVAYAVVNIDGRALTPYLFNTDESVEYMALVKRLIGSGTETQEELMVVSPEKTLLTVTPDAAKGVLANIALLNDDVYPTLGVSFYNYETSSTHFDGYVLPFEKFAGGDGTAESPYVINNVGDLQQIGSDPAAHYVLGADIDASGFLLAPVSKDFTGCLDGNSHSISNLTLASDGTNVALFSGLRGGATVKNITFHNATINIVKKNSAAALITSDFSNGCIIDNVHVYGLTTAAQAEDVDPDFGGLCVRSTLGSVISNSSVHNAVIDLPGSTVGGLVNTMFTGSKVKASAFGGVINGASTLGGIACSTSTGDEEITDCHVDAAITGRAIIGGIAGANNRATIARCYVEGTLKANGPGWTGPCVGGVAGVLEPDYSESQGTASGEEEGSTEPAPEVKPVVYSNYVALSSIEGFVVTAEEEFENQYATVHRIIGRSAINTEGTVDYDKSQPDWWNYPIITPAAPEAALADNFAAESLEICNAAFENAASSVEGASVPEDKLGHDFFAGLGFEFGTTTEKPWNEANEWDPALYFEQTAFFLPDVVNVKVGDVFNATLVFVSREPLDFDTVIDGFTCDSSNEDIAFMTGNASFEGNRLTIELSCEAEGTANVTAG
ncbi:MAG: hypothetical protein K2M00_00025, partial [Muribaculaceae bacterium]|nr:hypothetical protein [Muribaculaceae bacterium]